MRKEEWYVFILFLAIKEVVGFERRSL